jgi:hypothetical protein
MLHKEHFLFDLQSKPQGLNSERKTKNESPAKAGRYSLFCCSPHMGLQIASAIADFICSSGEMGTFVKQITGNISLYPH